MKIVGSGSLPTIDEDMIGRDGNEPNRHWLGILLLWFKFFISFAIQLNLELTYSIYSKSCTLRAYMG